MRISHIFSPNFSLSSWPMYLSISHFFLGNTSSHIEDYPGLHAKSGHLPVFLLVVNGTSQPVPKARIREVLLDSFLSITSFCWGMNVSPSFHPHHYLTLVQAARVSHLGHCNRLLTGLHISTGLLLQPILLASLRMAFSKHKSNNAAQTLTNSHFPLLLGKGPDSLFPFSSLLLVVQPWSLFCSPGQAPSLLWAFADIGPSAWSTFLFLFPWIVPT